MKQKIAFINSIKCKIFIIQNYNKSLNSKEFQTII